MNGIGKWAAGAKKERHSRSLLQACHMKRKRNREKEEKGEMKRWLIPP